MFFDLVPPTAPIFLLSCIDFSSPHPHSSVWVKLLALLAHSSWPFQVFHLVLPVAVWRHLYWTAHLSILHPSVIPFFPVFSSRYVPRDSSLSPFCSSVYCATICVCELVCVCVCFGLLWSVSPTLFMLCCSFPLLSLLHLLHLFFFFLLTDLSTEALSFLHRLVPYSYSCYPSNRYSQTISSLFWSCSVLLFDICCIKDGSGGCLEVIWGMEWTWRDVTTLTFAVDGL